MSAEADAKPATSLYARVISRRRSPWVTVAAGLALALAPMAAAYLDGIAGDLLRQGNWRLVLSPAAVITYILAVVPLLDRLETTVIDGIRPLVMIDGESFERLLVRASRISPGGEILALGLGAAFGVFVGLSWMADADAFWLRLVLVPCAGLMFGVLLWTIYVAISATRLVAELHKQPLRIDILDTTAFRPIGRQSLFIALVFVGGIMLGALFSLNAEAVLDWRNWILYLLLVLVAVLVFFLNMRPTHRVLSAEKNRELEALQRTIVEASRALLARIDGEERQETAGTLAGKPTGTLAGKPTGTLAAEINALVAYEERLQAASTWPYDTAMLRTLFLSVIVPGAAALARFVGEIAFE